MALIEFVSHLLFVNQKITYLKFCKFFEILIIFSENASSDSLLVLESRFQNVSQVVIQQEEEISKLNSYCRSLQIDLEKSLASQKILVQQQQELEAESIELQEFLQAEKTTLSDALKEAENEITKTQKLLTNKDKELQEKTEECKRITKLSEQRW